MQAPTSSPSVPIRDMDDWLEQMEAAAFERDIHPNTDTVVLEDRVTMVDYREAPPVRLRS